MSVDTLLSSLAKVRQTGPDRWMSRCPAHDDNVPSLSIRDAGDRVLLHCHAGCATEDVLSAVGLTFRDLYTDPWVAAERAATANPGREWQDRKAREYRVDSLAIDRRVVKLAAEAIKRGEVLSLEDQARVELALERLKARGVNAA